MKGSLDGGWGYPEIWMAPLRLTVSFVMGLWLYRIQGRIHRPKNWAPGSFDSSYSHLSGAEVFQRRRALFQWSLGRCVRGVLIPAHHYLWRAL
jgi:hypothetical protein